LWDTEPRNWTRILSRSGLSSSTCQFNDCTHTNEPGCAVRAAVDQGRIHARRYESYLRCVVETNNRAFPGQD
jgi:ribosome biogenesis GTPase